MFFAIWTCTNIRTIHPSIFYTRFILTRVTGICWSLSQPSTGERQGYTLDRSPVHHRATCRQTTTHTHIHTYVQFRATNQPDMHVFGLWEEAGVPGGHPHKHGENMQTPHRKGPSRGSNQEPSSCEATVLTTKPPCCPQGNLKL